MHSFPVIHQAHAYPCSVWRSGGEEIVERIYFSLRPSPTVKVDFLDQRIQDPRQRPVSLLRNRHVQISELRFFNLKTGVGIKTFLGKDTGSYQKIAEFNKQEPLYRSLSGIDLIKKIAEMRNERIDFTMRNYGLNSMIYHCILRMNDSTISVYEEPIQFCFL